MLDRVGPDHRYRAYLVDAKRALDEAAGGAEGAAEPER